MAKTEFISQSIVKRRTAAALAAAKDRHGWSDYDAADALGVSRSTIQNRLCGDDPSKQMTIHELLRSFHDDGAAMANEILALAGHRAEPIQLQRDETCDRKKASSITRANLAVSVMLEDNEISDAEIRERRQELEAGRDAFAALLSRIGPREMEG